MHTTGAESLLLAYMSYFDCILDAPPWMYYNVEKFEWCRYCMEALS